MTPQFLPDVLRECSVHGLTEYGQRSVRGGIGQCRKCKTAYVAEFRRKVKERLVAEFGGKCQRCGYNRCVAALQFHHRDPAEKKFSISSKGAAKSFEVLVEEARKCDLLCGNCHVEVEHSIGL